MSDRRVTVVGTAPSWVKTHWSDPGMEIWSLNDAWRMKGFQRADRWYDFHPLDRMFFHDGQQPVYAHQVPVGYFVRPSTHLEWLKTTAQTIPVYLHPDFTTQHPDAANWPHARPIPRAEIEGHFGTYFTSSPAFMMAQAMLEGVKEIWVTGIHLSTESEYVRQRPQFEMLCGRFLGAGKQTMVVRDGFRHYETPDAHLVLPEETPVCAAPVTYPFETHPHAKLEPLKWDLHKVQVKTNRQMQRLVDRRFWQRKGPMVEELARLQVWSQDISEQMQRIERGF